MAAELSPSGKSLLQAIAQQDPGVTYLDRFCRIQHVRGAGGAGADLFGTIPETQRESVRDYLNGVRESGDSRRFDVLLFLSLNEPVHWEHRVITVREGGVVNGFLIFATNLSRVLEAALDREAFFEAAPEMFCVVNMDGRIRDLNTACCELLGGSRDQLLGMPLVNFVNQEDSHHMRETLTSVIGRRRPSASLAVGIVGRPSPVRWSMSMSHRTESVVLVATMPELTDGPEATGLVDPGAVEKVQSPLSIAAEVARESMSEPHKSQTASSGSTGEASIGVASASGQDSTEATPLAASPTLATVTENSEPTSQSGLEIVDLYVQEFNSRLMSIMTNVELGRVSEDPGRVKLYLSQVEQEAQRASEITRKMVSWRDEPAWNRDTVPDERHFIRTSQRIVLIAEDDELVSDVVAKILEQASYRVLVCRNGKEAVEMCRRYDDIDLIFLDVVMPVMSGPEAASQITLIRPEIPLLFTSGFVGDSLTNANIPTGAPLLKKPYQTDALLKVIEEHIGPAQCTVGSEGTSGR